MPFKDTHSFEKNGTGVKTHYWTEQDERLSTQLRIDDESDSVTFNMSADSKGIWGPSVQVTTSVRMTYADLEKLVAHAQEILAERIPAAREGTQLPALRIEDGQVGPNEPVVRFDSFECRECQERSPWLRDTDDSSHYQWAFDHHQANKHHKFYRWSAGRNTMAVG